jgi:hypothetical protein
MGDYSNGMFGDLIFKINLVQQDGFEKVGGDLVFNNFLSINDLNAEEIARRAMKIAGDICIYTNHNFVLEIL